MSVFETEQLALFVTPFSVKELNEHLSQGWKVVQTCATSLHAPAREGFMASFETAPTCLVILERIKPPGQVSNVRDTGGTARPFPT
jgi:hypothetical protein